MGSVIIVGSGPAGISAALYAVRGGAEVTVISNRNSALLHAEKIENYYGFSDVISGKELYDNGVEGAKRLGVKFVCGEVVDVSYDGKFVVSTDRNSFSGDAVLLAMGASRKAPAVKGIAELDGKGISYCAVCDAFFYRGKDVVCIGSGEYCLHEAQVLMAVAKTVTVLSNGEKLSADFGDIPVIEDKIAEILGDEIVSGVKFEKGSEISTDGVFVALGVAGSTQIARKIGAEIDDNRIIHNENMATNVPGLYTAGDSNGGLLQISKAVYEGAMAGTAMLRFLRSMA